MIYANVPQIIFKNKQNIPWNEVEQYTKKLRGGLAKAKANSGQVIGEMIENAQSRRWIENKDEKHKKEASTPL
ncbi:MAG: hypothetical protein K2H31_09885 [Lachnospiraceae bacterium]|nr:hypothetical protein [Lachnospiraceae bacterium]